MMGGVNGPGLMMGDVQACIYDFAAELMRGTVSSSLGTTEGEGLCDRSGREIAAHQALNKRTEFEEMLAAAFDKLAERIDAVSAKSAAAVQDLTRQIMAGEIEEPFADSRGVGLMTRNSGELSAVKYINNRR